MNKISDFTQLINHLPLEINSFRIYKKNWQVKSQMNIVNHIFNDKDYIQISRQEIKAEIDIDIFILKILMWGYPTKGRGNNIENLLSCESFDKLKKLLIKYRELKQITFQELVYDFKALKIKGLGISTLSKFLYFLQISIDNNLCLILDDRLIDILNNSNFEEINSLVDISRENTLKITKRKLNYLDFLIELNSISKKLMVNPEKLEMFLFFFGKSL